MMIEQTKEELTEAIKENPAFWANFILEQQEILNAIDKAVAKVEANGKKPVH